MNIQVGNCSYALHILTVRLKTLLEQSETLLLRNLTSLPGIQHSYIHVIVFGGLFLVFWGGIGPEYQQLGYGVEEGGRGKGISAIVMLI